MKKKSLAIILTLFTLTSCSSESPVEQAVSNDPQPITTTKPTPTLSEPPLIIKSTPSPANIKDYVASKPKKVKDATKEGDDIDSPKKGSNILPTGFTPPKGLLLDKSYINGDTSELNFTTSESWVYASNLFTQQLKDQGWSLINEGPVKLQSANGGLNDPTRYQFEYFKDKLRIDGFVYTDPKYGTSISVTFSPFVLAPAPSNS